MIWVQTSGKEPRLVSSDGYGEIRYDIDVKNVFNVFLFWSRFYIFNVYFIFQTFFYLKKRWQSSERQADCKKHVQIFKITATK